MPGRSRGRMFDIRPEHGVEDTGTGSYPGYPGYGDSDVEPYDEYEDHYAELDARRGREVPARDPGGAGRTGGRPGAPNGHAGGTAATTAVRAAGRGGTGRAPVPTGRAPVPGRPGPASGRFRTGDDEGRVAPDGRWDEDEPPLLSHRNEVDEPAYARDRTPQGFDGGDPDEPGWGRGAAAYDDEYDEHDDYGDHDEQHDDEDAYDEDEYGVGDAPLSVPPPGSGGRPLGPADVEELDPSMTDALARVDLGSVQVPVPYGAELKLEPAGAERPQAVHLLLPEGRIAVSALAAPRSSGLWPDLAAEIEQSLRKGGARVRNNRGDWGRELHARTENAASVFVGCDGPRWMVYGVATASLETVEALDVELRRVLRGIIVVRGRSPYPPRTVLPLELPEHLREAQPEVAPQKPSITVSVPRPAGESGATPAAGSTGATPAPPPTPTASPTAGTAATGAIPRPAARPAAEAPARRGAGPAPVRRPGGADADPATRALPSVPRRPAAGPAPVEDARERTSVAGPVPPEDPAQRTAVASAPPIPSAGDRRRRARPDRPDRSARTGGAVRRDAAGTGARPAPDRAPGRAPEPFAARAPEPAPARDPEPAAEPPERRDPAVAALSVTDLLAGTEADPARGGAASRDRSASPDPGTDSAPGTGDTAADTGDTGAGAGDTGAGNGRRSRRRRADRADPATRIDAADLLAGREADAAPEEPDRRAAMAIEDIPLADVPLMEATLDREPEPEPEPAPAPAPASDESLPRRSRRRRPATDDADDADDWLSAEIAASRRAGRHGGGSGTSVADLLASAGLDDSGTTAGRRHSAPDGAGEPAAPPEQTDGEDLFRSPSAPSGSSTPSRPPALDGIPARGYLAGGPTSADEARSALQDLLRSASGPSADETGHGGSGVTGLADYRASRAGRRNGTRSGTHDDAATTDPYATEPDDHDEELPGRAAGGSGAAHPWTSGRRAGGTGPGDLGRHRRD